MAKKTAAPQTDFQKALKKSGANWDSAREKAATSKGGAYQEFDDGKYLARVQKMEPGVNTKGPYIMVMFKFVDGDYEGQTKPLFQNLQTDENLFHAAKLIGSFGYEIPENIADIESICEAITAEKPLCKITIKTKGEYQNVFLDKVISSDEGDEDAEEEDGDEDAEEESAEAEAEDEDETEEADEESEEEESEDEDEDEEEEEDEEEADEDDTAELEIGMRVEAETAKGTRQGVVHKMDPAAETVKIRDDAGKIFTVPASAVSLLADVPDEPEPPPAKPKGVKKPAAPVTPAPTTKKKTK